MFVEQTDFKSFPSVTVSMHHKVLPSDAKQSSKEQICLSCLQNHDGFIFLHTFGCQSWNKFSVNLKYLNIRFPYLELCARNMYIKIDLLSHSKFFLL